MNVKNEEKMGQSLKDIPSLKAFDAENGLTGGKEGEEEKK